MLISFARHGQTNWNVEGKLMGSRFDEPLNEEGHRQAQELSRAARTDFEVLIASPLKRAQQTAEYIKAIYGIPIEIYEEFREFDAGLLSGMKFDNIAEFTGGKLSKEKIQDGPGVGFEEFGGESVEAVRERVLKGIARIKSEHADKRVLVVTHIGVLRILYRLAGREISGRIQNASVIELDL